MGFELEHPNLTAYALGELEGDALARTEALIAGNEDARRRVEEIRAAIGAVQQTLARELDGELRSDQIEAIRKKLEAPRAAAVENRPPTVVPIAPSIVHDQEDATHLPPSPQPPVAPAKPKVETVTAKAPVEPESRAPSPKPTAPPAVDPALRASPRWPAVPRAPSRKKRSPAWAYSAGLAAAVALVAGVVTYRTRVTPPPHVIPAPKSDPSGPPDLTALLREREKNAAITPVSVHARSFNFGDTRSPQTNVAQDAPLSLTASDGTGLRLTNLTARAVIEEPLAFTELHLDFANPEARTLEGRFRIALPEGATISRFAMKIGDQWQEGEVVEKQKARTTYEDFLHKRQDPALLEQSGGNEFTARVFPIPPRATKQIIVSYSYELTSPDEPYRIPLVGLPEIGEASFRATVGRSTNGAGTESSVVELSKQRWVPDQDFTVAQVHKQGRLGLRNEEMLIARIAPIPESAPDEIGSLFVLLDTSASRALGFSAEVRLLQKLLAGLAAGAQPNVPVAVACFDQKVELVYEGPARGFGFDHVRRIEDRTALGASNLQAALKFVANHGAKPGATRYARVLVISDGVATAGATDGAALIDGVRALRNIEVERLDAIVTGGIRDQAMLERLVTAGLPRDGTVSDDRWDLARIAAKLTGRTYSNVSVSVEGAAWVWPEKLNGIQAGDSVMLYAELPPDRPVRVSLAGVPISTENRTLARGERTLVERAFAKARIDRLVNAYESEKSADYKQALQSQIVGLSVKSRVLSPFTALVVLETDADYARFGIARRSKTDLLTVENETLAVEKKAKAGELASRGKSLAANSDPRAGVELERAAPSGVTASKEDRVPEPKADPAKPSSRVASVAAEAPVVTEAKPPMPPSQPPVIAQKAQSEPDGDADGARNHNKGAKDKLNVAFDDLADEEKASAKREESAHAAATATPPPAAEATESQARAAGASRTADSVTAPANEPVGAVDRPGDRAPPEAEEPAAAIADGTVTVKAADEASGADLGSTGGLNRGRAAPATRATVGGAGGSVGSGPSRTEPAKKATSADQVGLTHQVIAQVVKSRMSSLAPCATQLRGTNASARRVVVELVVRPSGMVEQVTRMSPPAFRANAVGSCIAAKVAQWRFPSFYGPPISISVPIILSPPAPKRSETFRPAYQGAFAEIMALIQKGASGEALVRAERWRIGSPGDVLALLALGEACEAGGDVRRAERAYGSLIDLFPSRADMRRMAGERLERLRTPEGDELAEDTYQKAAIDRPDHPMGRRIHAYTQLKLGRVAAAFEEIESTIAQPNLPGRVAYARFAAALPVLREDLGLIGRAWIRAEPSREAEIRARVSRAGGVMEDGPSLRFVLNWETDANDVDLHVYDARNGHAYFGNLELPSGGRHYGGVFTGYGPECVTIRQPRDRRAHPYNVRVHYYAKGPMGYGMGKVQVIEHDGQGQLSFDERPFIAMNDLSMVELGVVR